MASTYTAAQLLLWKRLYGFNGWTTGPDTIGALLYGAAFFNVTSGDATCQINPLTALSSGADGEACTPTSLWNDTVWRELGGEVCFTSPGFLINPYYVADPSIEGCIDAFDAYRNATAADGGVRFTCNCSGISADHAFLVGGTRPSIVFTIIQNLGTALAAVMALPVGAWTDMYSRKKIWAVIVGICTLGFFGSAVLGSGYVWAVSAASSALLVGFTEVQTIPRQAYLDLFPLDEHGYIQGTRGAWSYASQLVFVAISFALTLVVPLVTDATVLFVIIGVWCAARNSLGAQFSARNSRRAILGAQFGAIL